MTKDSTLADSVCDTRTRKIKQTFFTQINTLLGWDKLSLIIDGCTTNCTLVGWKVKFSSVKCIKKDSTLVLKIMDINKATDLFRENYTAWLNNPERMTNGYNYEKTFVEMMQEFESKVFKESLGEIPINRNFKKKSKRV
ncbi:MAG: hypothetical protein JKY53_04365 [Flavobacteriales bacterium]|nr:hypothetical protein [Flavobacteriales bacterium]